jgi:hypothetical protein
MKAHADSIFTKSVEKIVRIVLMGQQALRQPQLSELRAGASAINIRNNAQLQLNLD